MAREILERHIPWPRDRHWRPGQPITLTSDGVATTYLLRGVMRDPDPRSRFATVRLEHIGTGELESDDELSAAG